MSATFNDDNRVAALDAQDQDELQLVMNVVLAIILRGPGEWGVTIEIGCGYPNASVKLAPKNS